MLILLPPSESKQPRRRGAPMRWESLSCPELTPVRQRIAEALAEVSAEPDATERLGLPPGVGAEVRRNTELLSAPAVPVSRLYSGVLYDALDLTSLDAAAKRRASRWVAVASALFGVLRLTDSVAPYRLSMSTSVPGLPPLAGLWRPVLDEPMTAMAGRGLVVDCRSGSYASAWTPSGDLARRWVHIRVPGATHGAKHTRGLVTRAICADALDPRTPVALADALAAHFDVALTPPARPTHAWTLDVTPPS